MRVLVTGASGFVGRWAVESLVARGVEVHVASRHPGEGSPQIVRHRADLLERGEARRIMDRARPDIILHIAWNVDHGKFLSAEDNLDWLAATLELAKAASAVGVGRFVGVGTCFEYCWPAEGNCDEAATPIAPTTLYAVAKDAARRVIDEMNRFSFAWARLFYLFGRFEHEHRLVASVASKLARDQPALLSQGLVVRDFMDTRDAGEALAIMALSDVRGAVNIASGMDVSVADIAKRLGEISGKSRLLNFGALPDRLDEPPRIVAQVQRLRDEVGFNSPRSLDQGLAETYEWWLRRVP